MNEDFQLTADAQGGGEIPQPKVLRRCVVLRRVKPVDPLQTTMQDEAAGLPVSTYVEFVPRGCRERAAGMEEAVVGIEAQSADRSVEA